MTKGYSKTLLQDFSRKSLEYIPNDYYMITKLLDRHQIGEIAEKISDSSMGNFEKYINFMIDKEYAFLTKDISLFPPKCHVVHDSLFPINDAIIEFNPIVSNMEEMYSYLKELNSMQCPYLQIRFSPSSNYHYIVDVVNRICTMDFECVDIHIADSHKTPMQAWNKLILKNAAVSRVYLYNQPQSKVFPFNVKPLGNENLLMGEIIAIKHPLDAKHCGKISKYTMQFFNEELYEVSKYYNSCLYKKIAINESGSVKNCLALDKEYDVSNGLAEIVYSKEFRQCWSIKKDNIKVCKDCELRYNCIDCRAGHQVDNGSKPVGCNYDPYKLIWNDEHK